jgi:hypothetical protein
MVSQLQIAIQVFYSRIRDDARRIVVNIAKLPKLLLPNVTSANSNVRLLEQSGHSLNGRGMSPFDSNETSMTKFYCDAGRYPM